MVGLKRCAASLDSHASNRKTIFITIYPKLNDSTRIENYQPIAILSSIAKLFDCIVNRCVAAQIKLILCDLQHRFKSSRSIETNLLILVDSISEYLDKGIQVDALHFDFRKASDRVNNDVF